MNETVAWSALSAALGWVAAQVWSVAKDAIYRFWIKRAITAELSQIYEETTRLGLIYERGLQLATLQAIEPCVPLPLSNQVFSNYYKDAIFAFFPAQRIAIQMIHAYVSALNEGGAELKALLLEINTKRIREGAVASSDVELFGGRIKGQLRTLWLMQWHIRHYLDHPYLPVLDILGPTHAEYAKYVDGLSGRIEKIEKSTEKLSVSDFVNSYDPRNFPEAGQEPAS